MAETRITRRRALKQLCGLVVVGGSATLIARDSSDESLRLIGKVWLKDHPADQATLVAMAGGNDSSLPDAGAFLERRNADFAAGRIAAVHGWVMAEAEVALCALMALEG